MIAVASQLLHKLIAAPKHGAPLIFYISVRGCLGGTADVKAVINFCYKMLQKHSSQAYIISVAVGTSFSALHDPLLPVFSILNTFLSHLSSGVNDGYQD
jgi:hypothetical protein